MILTTLKVNVSMNNEWAEGVSLATIKIDDMLAKRIIHLSEVVKKEKIVEVAEYDYTPDYYEACEYDNLDEMEPARTECEMLHVRDDEYYWAGYSKHGDVYALETRMQPIATLKELLKVAQTLTEDLPLLINELETDEAKALLKSRLTTPQETL